MDLNSLLLDMQRMLRPIIGEHVEFKAELDRGLGKVTVDPGQMEQVIMNLILNARDAMPQGGAIHVETTNCEMGADLARAHNMEAGPCVMLAIKDNGHGMDAHVLQHLWEPFFTTKGMGRGTGLGLDTVRKIIRQSRGDIWVRSTVGQGTTFTLCLPRTPEAAHQPENLVASVPVQAGHETVLVVEDEEGVRRLVTYVLNRSGYRVLEASNGEEALRLYETRAADIHLVLTDMVMPKMTGRELAAHITRIRPDARIVFMSGYTDDVLVHTGALGPGMSFLQKPLRPEVLVAKLREALDSPPRPFNPN